MARIAICAGAGELIVHVANGASDGGVSTRKSKLGLVVIKLRALPRCRCVAACAFLRKSGIRMVGRRCGLKLLDMT